MAPSVLNGDRVPTEKWSWKDTTLALALRQYEDSLCPGCHQPIALTRSDEDHRGHAYARKTYQCTACYEMESVSDSQKQNTPPGTKSYMVLDD